MLEGITKGALETLLAQGTGWVVAVLCMVAVIVLTRKNDALHKTCDDQRDASEAAVREQYEKRLAEFGTIMTALGESSIALGAMQDGVKARTEAINHLIAGFANLVRDLENNRMKWDERGKEIIGQLTDLRNRLEELQRRPQ